MNLLALWKGGWLLAAGRFDTGNWRLATGRLHILFSIF